MERTGIRFELYKLRSFFISGMLFKKVPGEVIAVLTGQASVAHVSVILKPLLRRLNRETQRILRRKRS